MTQVTKITSKRQITLPARICKAAGLKEGERLSISYEDGRVVLTPAQRTVQALDGILKDTAPKHWRGKNAREIIQEARESYLRHYRKP